MKKVRDQARKENKSLKSSSKGKAKAVRQMAANAVDNVVATKDAVSKKASEVKDTVAQAVQTVKVDTKAGIHQLGRINRDIAAGAGKVIGDIKRTGHKVAEKAKRP